MQDVATERSGTYRLNDGKNEERLAELILHIANKCETDPTFGAIKLNKRNYPGTPSLTSS